MPFVSGDASADFLTEFGHDWFFRTSPTDQVLAEASFSALEVAGKGEVQSVGILSVTDQQGWSRPGSPRTWPPRAATRSPSRPPSWPKQTDLTAPVNRLRAKRPDVVFVVTSAPDQTQRPWRRSPSSATSRPG